MEKLYRELIGILEEELAIYSKVAEQRDTPSIFLQPLADLAKRRMAVKAQISDAQ